MPIYPSNQTDASKLKDMLERAEVEEMRQWLVQQQQQQMAAAQYQQYYEPLGTVNASDPRSAQRIKELEKMLTSTPLMLPGAQNMAVSEATSEFSRSVGEWLVRQIGPLAAVYVTAVLMHPLMAHAAGYKVAIPPTGQAPATGLRMSLPVEPFAQLGEDASVSMFGHMIVHMAPPPGAEARRGPLVPLVMPEDLYRDVVAREMAKKLSNGRKKA